jgi:hypothetical protein
MTCSTGITKISNIIIDIPIENIPVQAEFEFDDYLDYDPNYEGYEDEITAYLRRIINFHHIQAVMQMVFYL